MPVVGASEAVFQPDNYWRGPVWLNVNWLSATGLECYGHHAEADRLRKSVVALLQREPTPREYYDPLDGHGLGALNFMWSGAVGIVVLRELAGDLAIARVLQDALGCKMH